MCIRDRITTQARHLVETGREIEAEFGIPIVNKRISVTPAALVGGAACRTPEDFVTVAETLDRAAHEVGVNFIGGYSALVSKGMTRADELLIRSIPMALARTERVCSSVNVGSTKSGINMDAVKLMGEIVKMTAESTKDNSCCLLYTSTGSAINGWAACWASVLLCSQCWRLLGSAISPRQIPLPGPWRTPSMCLPG